MSKGSSDAEGAGAAEVGLLNAGCSPPCGVFFCVVQYPCEYQGATDAFETRNSGSPPKARCQTAR
jgi:hypothetical protein